MTTKTETDYERHSREAQDLLERANSADWCEVQPAQEWLAKAQVHATLALAAATADPDIDDPAPEQTEQLITEFYDEES